jgi:hypothetical protein
MSMYDPKVWSVLRSSLSMGVPVKPRRQAFGRARRRLAVRPPYWLR